MSATFSGEGCRPPARQHSIYCCSWPTHGKVLDTHIKRRSEFHLESPVKGSRSMYDAANAEHDCPSFLITPYLQCQSQIASKNTYTVHSHARGPTCRIKIAR